MGLCSMIRRLEAEELQAFVDAIAASVAVLEHDPTGHHLVRVCNDRFRQMVEGGSPLTRTTPFALKDLLPGYARRPFAEAIDNCYNTTEPLEFEQVYDLRDGTRWWRYTATPVLEPSNEMYRVLLTGLDITSKIELEHELRFTSSRFASVIAAAYDGIVTIDQRARITLFNQAAEQLFGYSEEELLGQHLNVLLPEDNREHHDAYIDQFGRSPVPSRQMDERGRIFGRHKDGTVFPVEIAISKINVGGLIEFTAIIRDISDRVRLMDILEQQAKLDPLTGVPNRREFREQGEPAFQQAQPGAFSLLILDVDRFKNINDTHGHDRGDDVLRALAATAASTVRHLDVFARLGGEEFAVLMPDTGDTQASATAERIRRIYDEQAFEHEWNGEPIPFTVSVGVATKTESDADFDALLKRADTALYRAKESGRNRVEVD